ncbi:hypothetical protein [Psychrobacillus sp. FJAT-21963]|nr:hypothetical protein [Psychrobacillus sp. FJAT-21963]
MNSVKYCPIVIVFTITHLMVIIRYYYGKSFKKVPFQLGMVPIEEVV